MYQKLLKSKEFKAANDNNSFEETIQIARGLLEDDLLKGCLMNQTKNKYQLTLEEIACVLAYTGSLSGWINQRLRDVGSELFEEHKLYANLLDSALSKLPSTNEKILYRNIDDYKKEGLINETKKYFQYVSTSLDNFENNVVVLMITPLKKESKGRDIYKVFNQSDEKEVLFMRGAKFEVSKPYKVSGGVVHIYMKEII